MKYFYLQIIFFFFSFSIINNSKLCAQNNQWVDSLFLADKYSGFLDEENFLDTWNINLQCDRLADSLALVELFNATNGANWLNKWDLNAPMDQWFGIDLNDGGCVIKISITGNRLIGTLPNFSAMQNLAWMDLRYNEIEGEVPQSITNLVSLRNLYLIGNHLSGDLPSFFGSMHSLRYLFLNLNSFTGNIPQEYSNLTSLITLGLSGNNIEGEIPSSFKNWGVRALYLEDNSLTGDLSTNIISTLSNLTILNIADNNFYGLIPNFLETAPNIYDIEIQDNFFTFEDILPNYQANLLVTQNNTPNSKYYFFAHNTQKKFQKSKMIARNINDDITMDLEIDPFLISNNYKWYKDGELLTTIIGNNKLILNNIESTDFATYKCEVTNPNVPELTLVSHDIVFSQLSDCYFHYQDLHSPIFSHSYKAQTIIESSGIVETSSDVNFIAANSVTLKPGFHAMNGSQFLVKISDDQPCDSFNSEENNVERSSTFNNFVLKKSNLKVFPNPFQNNAFIQYYLDKDQTISLAIYSITGELIVQLEQGVQKTKGHYTFDFINENLKTGIYFVLLQTEEELVNQKIIRIE